MTRRPRRRSSRSKAQATSPGAAATRRWRRTSRRVSVAFFDAKLKGKPVARPDAASVAVFKTK